jgi:hypothetical protein
MALTILALALSSTTTLLAQELREEDYAIIDFGLINRDIPFITVEGIAGGSYDASLGDEGYQAYVFMTDKGNFMITVSQGEGNAPHYSTERLLTEKLNLKECLTTEVGDGEPRLQGHSLVLLWRDLDIKNINEVYSIQVITDDPNNTCKSGDRISKIFSQMAK